MLLDKVISLNLFKGNIMFNIYSTNYASMSTEKSADLYVLRKNVFKDRLQWAVNCSDGKELDEFDNDKTNYIFGVKDNMIICGTRMIDMKHKNMLNSAFSSFFHDVVIPEGNFIESTRFFVDKERTQSLLGRRFPVTLALFLSLINYARQHGYDGILAVSSHPMFHIIKSSGWNVTQLKTGMSEKNEPVHLLLGHVDRQSQEALKNRIFKKLNTQDEHMLNAWPLSDEPAF
ncbi:TPA: acyl-homoserine-lactone synthase [Serratia marcescens]|nr:acyl-homoserine-lactone synthase [Serratia marcescens]AVN48600.1 acyl-homoserine-lactone synthase [Serratia marcescens]AWC70377.1 acyl-homoserine-lactone synthase [Serratia marcescens]AWC75178.1 acyl-homoserine-lactone synthase [Serratia marcescens]AWC88333.1 acyl-homoserine-lactone synthase [Serratia marcescens]AWS59464.1 acyl-homoserine-lactone synthase [Serratia marcescens]